MDVSVIIINYNTKDMTSECISSIISNTSGIDYEIVVIDNASTDGSKDYFQNDNRIRYFYSYENLGFGRANNVGMILSKGEYIFLLNSDTLLLNNAILHFYNYAKEHDTRAFYGCWLENDSGKYIHSGGSIPTVKSILFEMCKSYIPGRYEGDTSLTHSDEKCIEVGYVTGADLFFHRDVYKITTGFDHNFFMYSEETDLQREAKKKGIKSYIINGPRIIHLAGGSQIESNSKFNIGKFRRIIQSRNYYVKKEYSLVQYIGYRICSIILYIPKMLFGKSACKGSFLKVVGVLIRGK